MKLKRTVLTLWAPGLLIVAGRGLGLLGEGWAAVDGLIAWVLTVTLIACTFRKKPFPGLSVRAKTIRGALASGFFGGAVLIAAVLLLPEPWNDTLIIIPLAWASYRPVEWAEQWFIRRDIARTYGYYRIGVMAARWDSRAAFECSCCVPVFYINYRTCEVEHIARPLDRPNLLSPLAKDAYRSTIAGHGVRHRWAEFRSKNEYPGLTCGTNELVK